MKISWQRGSDGEETQTTEKNMVHLYAVSILLIGKKPESFVIKINVNMLCK